MPLRPRRDLKLAVIGGGIGGLSAAIHLAASGAKVRLFERNERVGGKMNLWEADGFRFDTGPHVLTMLFALDELFRRAGTTIDAELDLVRLDPICRYHFPDGSVFDAPGDVETARKAVKTLSPADIAGFDRFLAEAERIYDQTTPTFLTQDFADHIDLRRLPSQMRDFWALSPFETLQKRIHNDFTHPKLRQIFQLYALYSGSDPARCSSLLSVIAHVQWNQGTYYPVGGIYKVAERLKAAARRLGVEIVTSARVDEIIVHGTQAHGVAVTRQGGETERFFADGVVCNRDALSAADLLPRKMRTPSPRWEPTPSAFLMLLGVRGEYPALAHHNSFLTADETGEYRSLWSPEGIPHDDPTIGVACQSVTDPRRAPKGCSNLFVMTNVPALGRKFVWTPEFTAKYRRSVLEKLEKSCLEGLSERILVEQTWTPNTFLTRYEAWNGALYGPSGNGIRQMFTRPSMTDSKVKGLFYTGGSVHPGGGAPLCALSGKIAAEKALKALG